ncbi:glycosyltransferase [Neorhizobium sp. SOG26]|nr:glycosyltransferase [Neorhizobium sp. SOG26]
MTSADRRNLDPKIYINRGKGFREEDAIFIPEGQDFVIIADVGSFGTASKFRLDPSSKPASFIVEATAFRSRSEADSYLARTRNEAKIHQVELGRLPRFIAALPRLRWKKASLTQRYAEASYQLAKEIAPIPHVATTPWLSIVVPVFNAPPRYLDDLVSSFEQQDQEGVELILSDDCSSSDETLRWLAAKATSGNVKIVRNATNGGIAVATNAGLEQALGEWVALLDHDDVIAPHALKMIRRALNVHPDTSFLYTDELVVDDQLRPTGTMLKPAYDPVLLTGVNYINHFSIYRRDRLSSIGGLRTGFDGSQDYDLLLRYLRNQEEKRVVHLPFPAYWWRRTGTTFSRTFMDQATTRARRAIQEHFAVQGMETVVRPALTPTLHRPEFIVEEEAWPKISVIIPSKGSLPLISRVLEDVLNGTDYPNLEVIVVDNGSSEAEVLTLYESIAETHPNFRYDIVNETFNFSRSINRGLRLKTGDHVLLLNNDVEVLDRDWLREMVSCLKFEGAGIVGAKLLFDDGTLQHAGVIVGFGGLAGHWYLNRPGNLPGPLNRLHVRNSLTCVTGAVMLISGDCLKTVGPWDEERFAVAYNDVDYCLRAHKAGFRIIWTPFARLRHHESLSRGAETGKEKKQRFELEKTHLREKHQTANFLDSATSPYYSRDRSTPKIVVPKKLAAARTGFYGRPTELNRRLDSAHPG